MPNLRISVNRQLLAFAVIALVSWCLFSIQTIYHLLTENDVPPFYWIQLFISLASLVGCVGWLLLWRRWRLILITTTSLYLAFQLLHFYVKHVSVWYDSTLWKAIGQTLIAQWTLITLLFSKGWVLSGLNCFYFELGMPLLQMVLLVVLLTSNLSFKRDALTRAP
jgi:hypothetical protein